MLDYRVQVFRTVAELKNITTAARRLHISQPAVSRHIKKLEEHFGAPLLMRIPTGVALTEPGRILLDHALRVDDLQDSVLEKLGQNKGILRGTLRLGASTSITQYYLPKYLVNFLRKNPEVKLSLLNGNTEEIIGAMLSQKIDIGLVEGKPRRRDLETMKFFEDEIICVASKNHPASKQQNITLSCLGKQQVILRETGSGTREIVEHALKKAGLKMENISVIAEISSSETIKGVLAGGLGISFLSRLSVEEELKRKKLREIKIKGLKIMRPFLAIYPPGTPPAGVVGAFLNSIT